MSLMESFVATVSGVQVKPPSVVRLTNPPSPATQPCFWSAKETAFKSFAVVPLLAVTQPCCACTTLTKNRNGRRMIAFFNINFVGTFIFTASAKSTDVQSTDFSRAFLSFAQTPTKVGTLNAANIRCCSCTRTRLRKTRRGHAPHIAKRVAYGERPMETLS